MFKNYLKTALRNLSRNKVYSSINIMGLSLGLACAMLIILYTKDELSYDRFHKNGEHIFRVANTFIEDGNVKATGGNTGPLQGPRFTKAIPEIKSFVRISGRTFDIKQGAEIKTEPILKVDSNFFSVFSFPLLYGNPKTALLPELSVVISEDYARKTFGTVNAMNKIISINRDGQFEPFLVTGIAKNCPQNSTIKFDLVINIRVSAEEEQRQMNWSNFYLNTFVMLNPGADIKTVEAKMKTFYEADAAGVIKEMFEKYAWKTKVVHSLQPLSAVHLSTSFVADNGLKDASNPMYSYILTGIALFILVIACINFVNLTIARSLKRAKEIGIRKVVGGRRKQLIAQFLGESFLLCFAAFVMSLVLAQLALPAFNRLSNKALSLTYLLDVKLVTGYIGLFLITGLLAGIYPALVLSGFNPVSTLYNRFNLSGKNYLQKSLVVLQFALSTLLIIATFAIYAQFNFLTTKELGYDDSNTVLIEKWGLSRDDAKLFKESLLKNHNIVSVAFRNGGRWGTSAKINGETHINFDYVTTDEAYLPLYKIPVVKGRNFSPAFATDTTESVLVNETFVKEAGWKEPLGQEVNFFYNNNEKYRVIGVVKDHHYLSLTEKIGAQLYTMKPTNGMDLSAIRIRPGSETESLRYIEATFKKIFPLNPYTYQFKDVQNRLNYEAEAKWKQMMLFGALLTIFISCIGLFGLSVLAAERRTKEIGIRKVLGASVKGLVTALSKDFLKLVVISMLIAIPAAWYFTNQWIQNYPYRIELSWPMFTLAGLLVLLIALVTVSFQAIKAAIANPIKSLRTE